jgi:hypothetical protein
MEFPPLLSVHTTSLARGNPWSLPYILAMRLILYDFDLFFWPSNRSTVTGTPGIATEILELRSAISIYSPKYTRLEMVLH